jgi:hypothetical protein
MEAYLRGNHKIPNRHQIGNNCHCQTNRNGPPLFLKIIWPMVIMEKTGK